MQKLGKYAVVNKLGVLSTKSSQSWTVKKNGPPQLEDSSNCVH